MTSSYKVLYKPTGKAGEYCQGYAPNLYNGCSHACEYCYAPLVRKVDREQFYNDVKPYKDVLEKLRHNNRDAILIEINPEYKGLINDRSMLGYPELSSFA